MGRVWYDWKEAVTGGAWQRKLWRKNGVLLNGNCSGGPKSCFRRYTISHINIRLSHVKIMVFKMEKIVVWPILLLVMFSSLLCECF